MCYTYLYHEFTGGDDMRIFEHFQKGVNLGGWISQFAKYDKEHFDTFITKKDIEYIAKLAMDNLVKCVVIGLPINMNGTRGERVEKSEQFASMLNDTFKELNYECKIDFQDERLTTVSSERVLIEAGVRRENRKKVIDKMAATIILQTYLDCHVGR